MVQDIVIAVSIMLISGFLMTRITKLLKLPNVTAYLIAGIILRPLFTSGVFKMEVIDGMSFISDIALAFIAFSIGQFFKFSTLKKNGIKTFIISLFDCIITTGLIFILTYLLFGLSLELSLVLSSVASVTGITAIVLVTRSTGSKGDFVDTMLEVIAIDTLLSIVLYSIAISISIANRENSFDFMSLLKPIISNIAVFVVGGLFGMLLKFLMPNRRTTDNRLIIAISTLFGLCGICAVFEVSPLIGCMSMGTIYYNLSKDDKLFQQLNYFSPPILLLFFVRSGISFDFGVFSDTSLISIVILFIIVRWAGKYLGSIIGSSIVGKKNEIRKYLGLTLAPLGTIAIGLAALAQNQLVNYPDLANPINTIIIASAFVYELFGPGLGKLALSLSHSYSDNLDEIIVNEYNEFGERKTEVDLIIEKIKKINESLPDITINENEKAFDEAAEELALYTEFKNKSSLHHNKRFRN